MDSEDLVRWAGGQGLPQRRYLDNQNDKRRRTLHQCHPAPREAVPLAGALSVLVREVTGDIDPAIDGPQHGVVKLAAIDGNGAARLKAAAAGNVERAGRFALQMGAVTGFAPATLG